MGEVTLSRLLIRVAGSFGFVTLIAIANKSHRLNHGVITRHHTKLHILITSFWCFCVCV